MRIDIAMEEEHRPCDPDLEQFNADFGSIGIPVEIGDVRMKPPSAGYGAMGAESNIVVTIDPETLRLIFEYATALVVLYKGHKYIEIIIKAIVEAMAKPAGAMIMRILSRLWLNLWRRIRTTKATTRSPKLVMQFEMAIEALPVSVYMNIIPQRMNEASERDQRKALKLFFFNVLPLLPVAINQSRDVGEKPDHVYVSLVLPESLLDSRAASEVAWRRGKWHWYILINPQREFIIDCKGKRLDPPLIRQMN